MDRSDSIPHLVDYSKYPLEFLVGSDRFCNLIQTMLEDPNQRNPIGYTLLHIAARSRTDNSSVVRLLIDKGADVNSTTPFGHTPLHFAVCSQKRETIEALIEAGASINSTDFLKRTALHFAISARWSHPPIPVVSVGYDMWIVKKLLRHPDTDLNPVDQMGETPLTWAVKERHLSAVNALLKKGADPNIRNNDKRTALHEALSVRNPSYGIVFTLLENGAGIYGEDKLGQSPVDILFSNVHDVQTLLLADKCVILIALRYRIRKSLKRQVEKFPRLSYRLKRCCKEVRLMRKQVIYDKVTVHDFVFDCFQSPDPMKEIYKPVIKILLSGFYIEYYGVILSCISNQNLLSLVARDYPELNRGIL